MQLFRGIYLLCCALLQSVGLFMALLAFALTVRPLWVETGEAGLWLLLPALLGATSARMFAGGPRFLNRAMIAFCGLWATASVSQGLLHLEPSRAGPMLIFWLLAALWGCWRRGNLLWAGYFGWFALCTLPICSGIFGWLAGRGDSHEEFHVAEPHVVLAIFVAMAAASKLTAAVLSCERSAFDESRFSELIRIEPEGDFGTVRRLPSI